MDKQFKKYLKVDEKYVYSHTRRYGKVIQQEVMKQLNTQIPPVFDISAATISKGRIMELCLLGATISEIMLGEDKVRVLWYENKVVILPRRAEDTERALASDSVRMLDEG